MIYTTDKNPMKTSRLIASPKSAGYLAGGWWVMFRTNDHIDCQHWQAPRFSISEPHDREDPIEGFSHEDVLDSHSVLQQGLPVGIEGNNARAVLLSQDLGSIFVNPPIRA